MKEFRSFYIKLFEEFQIREQEGIERITFDDFGKMIQAIFRENFKKEVSVSIAGEAIKHSAYLKFRMPTKDEIETNLEFNVQINPSKYNTLDGYVCQLMRCLGGRESYIKMLLSEKGKLDRIKEHISKGIKERKQDRVEEKPYDYLQRISAVYHWVEINLPELPTDMKITVFHFLDNVVFLGMLGGDYRGKRQHGKGLLAFFSKMRQTYANKLSLTVRIVKERALVL